MHPGNKSNQWVWVIIQNPGGNEQILGQFEPDKAIAFVPAFKTKEDAQNGFLQIPRETGSAYEIQAIIVEDLFSYARDNRFLVFILDAAGGSSKNTTHRKTIMSDNTGYQKKTWHAFYDEDVPDRLNYQNRLLPDYLKSAASEYPERTALFFYGCRISYRRLDDMVDRLATGLAAFGVQKGDRVAILLPNLIHCVVSYYAVLRIGAVTVMNNPLYTDRELEYQLNDAGAGVLITLDRLCRRMIALRPKTTVQQIVYGSITDYLPFTKRLLLSLKPAQRTRGRFSGKSADVFSWKSFLEAHPPRPPAIKLDFNDTAMLQYTGGTTGISKGVILTHGNLSRQIQQINAWFPRFNPHSYEVVLGALPFFHAFGLSCSMNLAICSGWGNILVPDPRTKLLLKAIRRPKPTFVPLVPTMYINILHHPDSQKMNLSSIKGCFSGSAPLPLDILKAFEQKTGAAVSEGFGMTESSPVTHANPFSGLRKVGSIGIPLPDTESRVVDLEDGETEMPVGEAGELIIKGPQVMKGYWNKPEETAHALRKGWLYTGDIARMDEDGYFFIVGRKKDMILSGGYNVYPRDIEEVFHGHPTVQEACAVGIPHPERGEKIVLFVVLKEKSGATRKELMEYARTRLAPYKLPATIEFRDELPKTDVGKIRRKDLREEIRKNED